MKKRIVLSFILASNLTFASTEKKEELICGEVVSIIHFANRKHLEPQEINPDFVFRAYKNLLSNIDTHKVFLSKSELNELDSFYQKNSKKLYEDLFFKEDCSILDKAFSSLENGEKRLINLLKSEKNVKNKTKDLKLSNYLDNKKLEDHILAFKSYKNASKDSKEFNDSIDFSEKIKDLDKSIIILNNFLTLLDRYTVYIENKKTKAFISSVKADVIGIGFKYEPSYEGLIIKGIVKNGSLDDYNKNNNLKIEKEDVIVEIQGKKINNLNIQEFVSLIPEKEGESVVVSFLKKNKKHTITVLSKSLNDNMRVSSLLEEYKGKKILKVKIPSFYINEGKKYSTTIDFEREYEKNKDADLIFIDLRDNGGGFISEAVSLSSFFTGRDTVFHQKTKNGIHDIIGDRFFNKIKKPVVILANKRSASAAEMFLGSMKDHGKAIIVGDSQSYGKGVMQDIYSDFSYLGLGLVKVTMGKYYSPIGQGTQEYGVKSDIVIFNESDQLIEKDNLNHLKGDKIKTFNKKSTENASLIKKLSKKYSKIIKSDDEDAILNVVNEMSLDLLKSNEEVRLKRDFLGILKGDK